MKAVALCLFTLVAGGMARADFSYSLTTKSAGAGDRVVKHFFKGNKMKLDQGETATIIDFDAETITHIDNKQKMYRTIGFDEFGGPTAAALKKTELTVDVKETGQQKTIT